MRLPFILADFTRIIWHSAVAKEVWAPRISKINQVWPEIERQAVVDGMRDACLTFVDPQNLPEVSMWAAKRGLVVVPLGVNGVASQYSSTSSPVVAGRPFQYRIVLTRPELAAQWSEVWTSAAGLDNQAVGKLLGYPSCCRDFFEKVWVADQGVDTTWEQAFGTGGAVLHPAENKIVIPADTFPEANILLRWLGVRLVPHLPHSFDCAQTVSAGRAYADLGRTISPVAVDWMYEMLDWPVEWSALHGIAEVRTPVLTISTRTTATGEKQVVQREGQKYPEEGARGLRFPFRVVQGKVTDKPAYKRSVQTIHELNGFGSQEFMERAHSALLRTLPLRDKEHCFLMDLGCGTGRFLERAEEKGWTVVGVEQDNVRAGAAKVPVRRGSLFDFQLWAGDFDVIAFMPGRLLEVEKYQAEACRELLKQRAKAVLVYAYGDWIEKYGGLGPLVASAGLGNGEVISTVRDEGVEAALLVFNKPEEQNVEGIGAATVAR